MEWLFIFGLAGVTAYLWNRMERAERRLDAIDLIQEHTAGYLHELARRPVEAAPQQDAEAVREPPRQALSVPPIARHIEADRAPARIVTGDAPSPLAQAAPELPEPEEPHYQSAGGGFADRYAARLHIDFEDIFGRKLPIWAGGVALAVAGVFLVRYSIEAGLLTPTVRVLMAFLFGVGLLCGAEAAYRLKQRIADPRFAQALAGAGLATLYAGFYLAGTQYGLVGQTVAFLGLGGVTALAIALSFRFGLPSAILGLVGGFAAPALVGGEDANLPLLALYLGLVTAGLAASGRRQERPWMGIGAMIGGLGWGAALLMAGDPGVAEVLALGLYFLVLGTLIPALAGTGTFERPLRLASAAVASLQLALLVEQGGYAPLAWGLYLLLGAALAFFGWKRSELRVANAVAALVGLQLFSLWTDPPAMLFAAVGLGLAAIFAGVPLALVRFARHRFVDLAQLSGMALGLALVAYLQFGDFDADSLEPVLSGATFALAAFPLLATRRLWTGGAGRTLCAMLAAGSLLVFAGLLMVTPAAAACLMGALVFAGLYALLRAHEGAPVAVILWGAATIAAFSLFGDLRVFDELERLGGGSQEVLRLTGALRWGIIAAVFGALALHRSARALRFAAEGLAALMLYGALAQLIPADFLAWTAAAIAIGGYHGLRRHPAAQAVALLIAAIWALDPAGRWVIATMPSLFGEPALVGDLPAIAVVATRLAPALLALWLVRLPLGDAGRDSRWLCAPLALVAAHSLFKQVFAIETVSAFVERGLAERTLWEALLLAAAWLSMRGIPRLGASRLAAIALALIALAHFAAFTLFWHNPLFDRQAVGPAPIANLALVAYAVATAALWSLRLWLAERLRPWTDGLIVAVVSIGALTLLRQSFAGSILIDDALGQSEDLLRSLGGIVLAIGFLLFGARREERSWRVGSLVLMLLAVGKVFIFDAAGLEGLLRIASFMALGFSLIGIGWLYSRQLKAVSQTDIA